MPRLTAIFATKKKRPAFRRGVYVSNWGRLFSFSWLFPPSAAADGPEARKVKTNPTPCRWPNARKILTILAFILTLLGAILSSQCKRSPAPALAPSATRDTLVICVGGLWGDHTRRIAEEIDLRCTRALVCPVGTWNSYKVDIRPIMLSLPKKHTVLVLHSFACWHVVESLPPVDYVVLLDPVSPGGAPDISFWGDEIPSPAYAARVDWFRRMKMPGPPRANVRGLVPIPVPGDHNQMTEDPTLIDCVVTTINAF